MNAHEESVAAAVTPTVFRTCCTYRLTSLFRLTPHPPLRPTAFPISVDYELPLLSPELYWLIVLVLAGYRARGAHDPMKVFRMTQRWPDLVDYLETKGAGCTDNRANNTFV